MSTYESLPGLRISQLSKIGKSPKCFKWHIDHPGSYKETPALRTGIAIHMYLLELDRFNSKYALFDGDRRTKEGKEQYAGILASGFTPLKASELAQIVNVSEAVKEHPLAAELLDSETLKTEQPLQWEYEGVQCKGLVDGIDVERGIVFDLKTTLNAAVDPFSRDCIVFNYYAKAAWYLHGARAVYGKDFEWRFIAVEKTEPHHVGVYGLSGDVEDYGEAKWKGWMSEMRRCKQQGVWVDINEGLLEYPYIPGWAE